ncbi:NADPH-dependent glutamate synthase beta chain [Desulfofustis glycolicus DSM 9705]|uniref:NADPH-dependent glutamate synthase beta chain n=1 Tax=Desulfofustis glycolicus DSM 9705 TaxID=1121409 RepID=A0A1M5WDU7_9BACT|nr:FAD-dependent oxidoreductase [Desulfofustis glycolicus]SHH85597.1 NADPH-dependent glutamate synthase beta chain [Desulfofustis glycolicus DSM 9705]
MQKAHDRDDTVFEPTGRRPRPIIATNREQLTVKPTNIKNPEYFHKVIDCQFACPAHTAVPEYIRLILHEQYTDAYLLNWHSNVFPGILGRVCDRPCEPACRRGRVEEDPVAICRLKRVAADHRDDVLPLLPPVPRGKNGKRVALVGAGPASLTVARDLALLGYELDLYDDQSKAGGFIRSQIPSFRLPEEVIDTEMGYILDRGGITTRFNTYVADLQDLIEQGYDAIFVGTGAPRGRDLPDLPGRSEADKFVHIGIDWLAGVVFRHVESISRRVLVLGGGNTAMDCCRTARRLGGEDVTVVVRSPQSEMKASEWEIEDAMAEDIPIIDNHVPLEFVVDDGILVGMRFDRVEPQYDKNGRRRLVSTGEEPVFLPCDEVLLAIGQQNAFPFIAPDSAIEFNDKGLPVLDPNTLQSSVPSVFFGGDAAFGPGNIIIAVEHGHQAAISIDLFCRGEDLHRRPAPAVSLADQKLGFHDWIYDSQVIEDGRQVVPTVDKAKSLHDRLIEVELGFPSTVGKTEAKRCLNCDVQTVFDYSLCIECDACVDICPTTCINFTDNGEEDELRERLLVPARNKTQDLYVSETLPTGRVMVKDEDVCLHCGMCAERCPTAAWTMVKFVYQSALAGDS